MSDSFDLLSLIFRENGMGRWKCRGLSEHLRLNHPEMRESLGTMFSWVDVTAFGLTFQEASVLCVL